eukprot:jgi/Ulvmu1/6716/UM030_0049.1
MTQRLHMKALLPCSAPHFPKSGPRHTVSRLVMPGQQPGYQAATEALSSSLQNSQDVRQVVNSASQLASSPLVPGAGATSVRPGNRATAQYEQARTPKPAHPVDAWPAMAAPASDLAESTTSEDQAEHTSLSSLFDDIQSDIRSASAGLSPSEKLSRISNDPPKACRSPAQVLPRNVQEKPDDPLASLPKLPRSIHRRPQLFPHFSNHIHPTDEWLLYPQPPSAVAARLRSEAVQSVDGDAAALTFDHQRRDDPWSHADAKAQPMPLVDSDATSAAVRNQVSISSEEVPWNSGRLITLLRALSSEGLHATACELLQFLFHNHGSLFTKLDLSRQAVLGLIWEWSKDQEAAHTAVMLVTGVLGRSPTPPPVLRAALTAAATTGSLEATQRFFDELRRAPGELDGQAFGLLISVYGKAGRWRSAAAIFAQMRADRIEPTVKTYTTLIKACTAAGAPERAVAFFAQMESAGVRADLLAYNSLMGAFSRTGDWERAWSVLGAMRRAAVDPDIVSYNTLLKACERAGAWPRVEEVYTRLMRECADSGRVRPNVITFNTMISAAGRAGEWEQALELYEEMDEHGVLPDQVTMSSLVNALELGGQWEEAISRFKELQQRGVRPNAICYNAAISALAKGSQANAAKALVRAMRSDGLVPDLYTYGPLVTTLGRAGLVDEAFQVWEDMKAEGVEGNTYVYVALITACERSSDWQRAVKVFYAMREADVEMNALSAAARQILYQWPQVLNLLPPPIVAAARAAVDSGRAARNRVHTALQDIPTEL